MWQIVCKCVGLLTACGLLLSTAAGCSNHTDSLAKKLFDSGIVIDNNLDVETVQISESDDTGYYIQISGLRDSTAEDKINRRLKEAADEMYAGTFIPPYRGISVKLKQSESLPKSQNIYMYTECNWNHILSVCAYYYASYYDQETPEQSLSYGYEIPLTFDLTTGDEMTLKDLFTPGTDYIEQVNRAVDQYLMHNGFDGGAEEYEDTGVNASEEIALTAPFRSIEPDQKFLLAGNGNLYLVMDYDTPVFYNGYYPITVDIPSDDLGEVFTPFRSTDKPLYQSERKTCHLLTEMTDRSEARQKELSARVSFYGEYRYSHNTPEALLPQLEALTFDESQSPIAYDEVCRQVTDLFGHENWRLNIMTSARSSTVKSHDYYSFTRDCSFWSNEDNAWSEDNPNPETYYRNYQTAYCFDRDGHTVALRDLFCQPEQADKLIADAMERSLIQAVSEETAISEEDAHKYVSLLFPHINGVSIESVCLYLSFDLSNTQLDEIFRECFGEVENSNLYSYGVSYLTYQDIGCENLILFRDAF